MKLTENDIAALRALADYYVLSASLLHRMVFPQRKDRRNTRRRLQRLVTSHYIARSAVEVAFSTGNAGPAYFLTAKGADALAVFYGDEAWLKTNVRPPRIDRLYHWLDIAECHWIISQAVDRAPGVTLVGWVNEWQTMSDVDGNPTDYVLHTQFREGPKPLSCSPDAAFCLKVAEHQRVHYVEIDRGATGCKRVAASKMPSYYRRTVIMDTFRRRRSTTLRWCSSPAVRTDAKSCDRVCHRMQISTRRSGCWQPTRMSRRRRLCSVTCFTIIRGTPVPCYRNRRSIPHPSITIWSLRSSFMVHPNLTRQGYPLPHPPVDRCGSSAGHALMPQNSLQPAVPSPLGVARGPLRFSPRPLATPADPAA